VLLLVTGREADLCCRVPARRLLRLPRRSGGLGLVVLEALARRAPVVASDIPGFRQYLEDGHRALLVPPGDPGLPVCGPRPSSVTVALCLRLPPRQPLDRRWCHFDRRPPRTQP